MCNRAVYALLFQADIRRFCRRDSELNASATKLLAGTGICNVDSRRCDTGATPEDEAVLINVRPAMARGGGSSRFGRGSGVSATQWLT
jgi:hypothetical protein